MRAGQWCLLGDEDGGENPIQTEKVAVFTCAGVSTASKIPHIWARDGRGESSTIAGGRLARDVFQVHFAVREVAMMRDLGR